MSHHRESDSPGMSQPTSILTPSSSVVTYTYPTVEVYVDPQYSWNGTIPYTQEGTATCVQAASGTTAAYPSISDFPTQAVQEVDLVDHAGWTYCYQPFADALPVNESFYSLFDGLDDIFVAVSNESNCEQVPKPVVGPVQAVSQVAFLFQQTTSYINDPGATKTSIAPSNSDQLVKSSVLVDPFQLNSQSASTEAPLQSPSSNVNVALPVFHETTSSEEPSVLESKTESPAKTSATTSLIPPVELDNNEESVTSQAQSTKSKDVNTEFTSPPLVTSNPGIEGNGQTSASASPGTVSKGSLENLNSLINVIVAGQSSSSASLEAPNANSVDGSQAVPTPDTTATIPASSAGPGVVESHTSGLGEPASQSEETTHAAGTNGGEFTAKEAPTDLVSHPQVTQGVSSVLTFGDATATVNTASEYVFGDQTLKPDSSAIVISGTSISLVQGATAVVLGPETATPTNGSTAQELTIRGVIVTAIPVSSKTTPLEASNTALSATSGEAAGGTTTPASVSSEYLVAGQTVRPGAPAITVSGTRVSLAPGATALVVGTETKNLQSTTGVGDYIWSGIAGALSDAQTSSTSVSEPTGVSTASDGSAASGTVIDSPSTDVLLRSLSIDIESSTPTAGSLGSSISSPSPSSSVTGFASEGAASQPHITTAMILLAIGVFYLSV
jgi:hypothetical protein